MLQRSILKISIVYIVVVIDRFGSDEEGLFHKRHCDKITVLCVK